MLAGQLLESLDDEAQKRIDATWAEEAERRAQAIDEGKTKLILGRIINE